MCCFTGAVNCVQVPSHGAPSRPVYLAGFCRGEKVTSVCSDNFSFLCAVVVLSVHVHNKGVIKA